VYSNGGGEVFSALSWCACGTKQGGTVRIEAGRYCGAAVEGNR
jgi:hypothetical protein